MIKLSKTYQTKPDAFGFKNEIEISADYANECIDNIQVKCYSWRKGIFIDITDIFEESPFSSIVADIDWIAIAREQEREKEEIEALNAELDADEIVYKEGYDRYSPLQEIEMPF